MGIKKSVENRILNLLENKDVGFRESRDFIWKCKEELKKDKLHIDDVLFSILSLGSSNAGVWNKASVSTSLIEMIWSRLSRRSVSWHEGGEILTPKINQISKLEVVAGRYRKVLCESEPYACVYDACMALIMFAKGDYKESSKVCAKIRSKGYPLDAPYRSFLTGVNSFYFEDFYPDGANFDLLESFSFNEEALAEVVSSGVESLNIVSCDEKYFDKFSKDFIDTAEKASINHPTVFFVISEKEGFLSLGEKFYLAYVKSSLPHEPALYASFRYLVSQYIVERSSLKVFVFDIDFVFDRDICEDMLDISSGWFDVALTFHGYGIRSIAPWSKVSAPFSYFSQSRASKSFLMNYVGYWMKKKKKSTFRWWIDQNALFSSYQYISRSFPSASVYNAFDVANKGCANNREGVLDFKKLVKSGA